MGMDMGQCALELECKFKEGIVVVWNAYRFPALRQAGRLAGVGRAEGQTADMQPAKFS